MSQAITTEKLLELNAAQTISETDVFTERRYAQFASLVRGARVVLDVGCNTGRGGRVLRDQLPSLQILHGADLVAERIEVLPNGLYDEAFSVGLEELQTTVRYDAIVAGEVIEHVPYSTLDVFLAAIRGLLAPHGVFLLTTPNPHYIFLKRRSGGSVVGGSHVSVHCARALTQYLRYRGFVIDMVLGSGRVSSIVGSRLPLLVYGSYLIKARAR